MQQMTIFDFLKSNEEIKKEYKIKNKVRLIELFAGIGSQSLSLDRLGVDYESYKVVEFDKYACDSYNKIHSTNYQPTDITKISGKDLEIVNCDKYTYLLTYSFPCVDISVAGAGKGYAKGDNTRSGLLWEVERLLNECKALEGFANSNRELYGMPQVLLMENVVQVHSKSNGNIKHFEEWLAFLEGLGYSNFYQDINSRDMGIPQNRNRCFCISILGKCEYKFPKPIELEHCVEEYLEDEDLMDERYYISQEKEQVFFSSLIEKGKIKFKKFLGWNCNE